MSAIGGFLPLEIASGAEPYHPNAVALASGRACWHVILRTSRPSRVLVPFYVCDAVLEPLAATGIPYTFYPVTESLRPDATVAPARGELMLLVNYFGVMTCFVDTMVRHHPGGLAVDDTQAFFRLGSPDVWSFNSARKFFGVPDGGFMYGPATDLNGLPPSDIADCEHLLTRLAGDDTRAWDQFKRHEARIGIEPQAMSIVSARLLGAVDMARVRNCRRLNFEALHRRLHAINTVALSLEEVAGEGPMCYPFLPAVDVDRAELGRRGVFVPTLWPEIEGRPERGFERERLLAGRLLPLPIDQRYGPDDMERLCQVLLQVLP
jgi:hypothetical protein